MRPPRPPIIWSIAGLDTAGGAGLSADQRAADALGVHLCPVAACLTAQHSLRVAGVFPVDRATLDAQLQALSQDMPPRAIKTGLLGSVHAIETVAQWTDRLRATTPPGQDPHRHLALIVDPVLGASAGGTPFSDEAIVAAYRTHLLPRATVITPNRAEALRWLGQPARHDVPRDTIPALAQALRASGARSVVITGGDAPDAAHSQDWIDTPHAHGWLSSPRLNAPHTHGSGCTFATGMAAAWALGHVEADAAVLAKMLTHHAISHGHAAGHGLGPVCAQSGFAAGPHAGGAPLPWLGLGRELPWQLSQATPVFPRFEAPPDLLYGIVPDGLRAQAAVAAGMRCLQLRHKPSATAPQEWAHSLAVAAPHGGTLFLNDHWRLACDTPKPAAAHPDFKLGLHLGQEDLLAMTPNEHVSLRHAGEQGLMLGLSSHSLWELARAAGCGASTIACGPVQATLTKDMPWQAQGTDNLAWWIAHSPAPTLAIGGLLHAHDLARFAPCQPAAYCVVRGLGQHLAEMQMALPRLRAAVSSPSARSSSEPLPPCKLPHPVLAHSPP